LAQLAPLVAESPDREKLVHRNFYEASCTAAAALLPAHERRRWHHSRPLPARS
jgi:hypothetical protein